MHDQFPYMIQSFDADSPNLEGAVRVFSHTWQRSWNEAYGFIWRYARSFPDFYGFVARDADDEVVGMGFGTRSLPGQWWHDRVAAQVGADHPAIQDSWVLTEFAVLEQYRGRGIGSRLHDDLLKIQPCPRVLLSTEVSNHHARRFYEHRSWQYLHPGFVFEPGDKPYLIMHKELQP